MLLFFSLYSASGCPIACKNKEKYQSHATSGITYAEKFGASAYSAGGSNPGGIDGTSNDADQLKEKGDQPMDTSEEGHIDEKVYFTFLPALPVSFLCTKIIISA